MREKTKLVQDSRFKDYVLTQMPSNSPLNKLVNRSTDSDQAKSARSDQSCGGEEMGKAEKE